MLRLLSVLAFRYFVVAVDIFEIRLLVKQAICRTSSSKVAKDCKYCEIVLLIVNLAVNRSNQKAYQIGEMWEFCVRTAVIETNDYH